MNHEKRTGEVNGASTHSFCIHCLLPLNFSFVLRVFMGLAYMYGLVLSLFEDQAPFCTGAGSGVRDTNSCFNWKEVPA
jgi:hypothetical protein